MTTEANRRGIEVPSEYFFDEEDEAVEMTQADNQTLNGYSAKEDLFPALTELNLNSEAEAENAQDANTAIGFMKNRHRKGNI